HYVNSTSPEDSATSSYLSAGKHYFHIRWALFQQMYKPLSQEEVGYIRERLEEYTNEVRRCIHKLNGFDCAVILADTRTLFLYIALFDNQNPSGTVAIQN
ncbi:hypothetical protein ACJ73_07889, partial [Blastomyces percursus]